MRASQGGVCYTAPTPCIVQRAISKSNHRVNHTFASHTKETINYDYDN